MWFFFFHSENGDESSPVLCLLTRPEDELSTDSTMQQQSQTNQLEQITFRLDTHGVILKKNTDKLRKTYMQSITKDNSCRSIQDITHMQDLTRLQSHLTDVMQNKSAQSLPYRIRFGQDVYVYVKAFSQYFQNNKPNESDFIMSINTLLTDSELSGFDANATKTPMSLPSTSQVNAHNSNMGGPLMTSVMNGTGIVSQMQNSINDPNLQQDNSRCDPIFSSDAFDFQFTDAFDMNGMESVGVSWDSRPDSRASGTPVSTPRPASAFSPVTTVCQSPLTGYHTSQPSPIQQVC